LSDVHGERDATICEDKVGKRGKRHSAPSLLSAPFRLRNRRGDLLDQIHQRHAARVVLDGRKRVSKPERPRVGQEREQRPRRAALGAVEQRGDRYAQDGSNFDEAPGADPIGAHLVLLDLLECDAEPLRELPGQLAIKAQLEPR